MIKHSHYHRLHIETGTVEVLPFPSWRTKPYHGRLPEYDALVPVNDWNRISAMHYGNPGINQHWLYWVQP